MPDLTSEAGLTPEELEALAKAFGRWGDLKATVAQLLAEAWDDGYDAGHQDARAVQPTYPADTPNPHRAHIEGAS